MFKKVEVIYRYVDAVIKRINSVKSWWLSRCPLSRKSDQEGRKIGRLKKYIFFDEVFSAISRPFQGAWGCVLSKVLMLCTYLPSTWILLVEISEKALLPSDDVNINWSKKRRLDFLEENDRKCRKWLCIDRKWEIGVVILD